MTSTNFFLRVIPALLLATGTATVCSEASSKNKWDDYNVGEIIFHDKSPETKGSQIYHNIIAEPKAYITDQAHDVLETLYFSPKDSIVPVNRLHYTLEDVEGISAKSGGNGDIAVFYSTRHIENSFVNNDTAKVLFETRGVLLHELTHAFQLEPQGIGHYGNSRVVWAFIEGMADAVRVANGGFTAADRPRGGHYTQGYRHAGFFFNWLRETKDRDFLRKFNRSTLEVVPWSFDGGIKYAIGPDAEIETLWDEYMTAMGDKTE